MTERETHPDEGQEQTFLEHLGELRNRLLRWAAVQCEPLVDTVMIDYSMSKETPWASGKAFE